MVDKKDLIADIDKYISPLIKKTTSKGSELNAEDLAYIKDLIMNTAGPDKSVQNILLMITALMSGLIGQGLVNAIKKKDFSDIRGQHVNFLDFAHNKIISESNKIRNRRPITTELTSEDRQDFNNALNVFSMNYLNKWEINFGPNKTVDNLALNRKFNIRKLLSLYCTEHTIPGFDTERKSMTLPWKSQNVASGGYHDLTLSFYCDSNLYIRRVFDVLNDAIMNKYTGRHGFRDNYVFQFIEIIIKDQEMQHVAKYKFYNCMVNTSEQMIGTQQPSETKLLAYPFSFDWHECDDEYQLSGESDTGIR